MKKVVFLGGKEIGFFCLNHLLEHSSKLEIEVVGVLTSNKSISKSDFSFSDCCKQYAVPILRNLDELLTLSEVDIIVSVQYHQLLDEKHIQKANQISVNLHMAPLPEYRGCNQFSFAIIDGVKEFGTSFHQLEKKIDGGDLLFERRFAIEDNVFVSNLYEKTLVESQLLFAENIKAIIDGDISPVAQNKLATSRTRGFHLRKEMQEIKRIAESWKIEKQKRYFRATFFPPFLPPVLVSDSGNEQPIDMNWYKNL